MSDQTMHTTVRVDSVGGDTSAIDRMLAKLNKLQATVAKMARTPSMGLAASLDASARKAQALGATLARNDAESAANLRRRLGAEKRLWTQSAREAEKAAKVETAASAKVAAAKLKDAAEVDRSARRDAAARFANGARDLRARITGERIAAQEQMKASVAAERAKVAIAKAGEKALIGRFAFEDRMRRQRNTEEAAAARETASAHREATRIEARGIADRERARASETRRRASAWSNVRSGASTAATRGREAFSQTGQIARSAMVVPAAAIGASVRGIAGRMQVDAAETSLKIFGDDSGKKFTSKRIAEIRKDWLDSAALETGNTSTDGLKAYTEINKAGIRSPKENTQLLLKAGAGLEIDTGATAKLMGLVDRNLGAASTPKRMQSVLNSIAVAAREDPTNAPEIIEGMKRGFGALSLGNMSPEHLAGLVSGAQSVGVQPGKAGTFISTLMKDLTAGSYARGQRGKDLNEAARMLGFGSARNMANSAATDSTATILRVLERLEAMPELQRSKATNRLSQTQWSDEDLMMLQGLGGLKKTLGEIDNPKNSNFLDDASNERMNSWEKQWARSKAIFSRFWESIGAGFDGIFHEVNSYFLDSAKKYDFSRITDHVKSFLSGFVEGLGFKDIRSLMESALGKPGEQGTDRIEKLKSFGRGLGDGLRSIGESARSLMSAFSGGSNDPEVIGRLTGKLIGLSAALLVLSPAITVLGTLVTGIAAVAGVLKAGKGLASLMTSGAAGAAEAGAGAAGSGILARLGIGAMVGRVFTGLGLAIVAEIGANRGQIATWLGAPQIGALIWDGIKSFLTDIGTSLRKTLSIKGIVGLLKSGASELVPAPVERYIYGDGKKTDAIPDAQKTAPTKALNDAFKGVAPLQKVIEESTKVQKHSFDQSQKIGDLIKPASFSQSSSSNVQSMGARLQLAALSGSGALAASGIGQSIAGSASVGAAGLGEIRGAGGTTALMGALPGQALPGQSLRSRDFNEDGSSTVPRFNGRRFGTDNTDPRSTDPRFAGRRFNEDGTDPNSTSPRMGGRGVIDPLMSTDVSARATVAHDFFRSKGLSEEATAGILASMKKESNFTPNARGDGGRAHGLFQHHADRRAAIQRGTGIDMSTASFGQQLEGAWWEMNNGDKGAQRALRILQTPGISAREAGGAFVQHFERPARDERGERGALAEGFARQFGGSSEGGDVLGQMRALRTVNQQCVSLAKAAVGSTDSVLTWQKGVAASEGTLKPGTPIATFLDRMGRQSERYAGGGTGTPGARLDHAGVFESYIRDRSGKITGMNVAEQYAGSRGVHSKAYRFGEGFGEANASNYSAIQDKASRYLGGNLNPMNRPDADTADKPFTSTGWKRAGAEDLAAESPAQKLARSAPKMPGSAAAGGGSAKIEAPIHINHIGDAQSTANAVQRRIQDVSGYHTQDRSYESI